LNAITQVRGEAATDTSRAGRPDMKLEVVVIPVSNVARAAEFYAKLGWRRDADITTGDRRVLQFTPPGSPCSIIFGTSVTPSDFGPVKYLHLAVSDIKTAREALIRNGVEASEVFHDAGGGYNPFEAEARASGPDPARRSYLSFVTFGDPDGNVWLLQEVTARLPGRIDSNATDFASVADLAAALRRAETAHGEHEKRTGGQRDENWPDWYAAYMVAEQAGKPLPL
jgi:catechol 2,3-dioxygenase-like lactoylglutathione lyase family enzyme